MTTAAVSFERVSKKYPRGGTTTGPRYASLRHDLSSIGKRTRARLHGRGAHEQGTLALEDVSFEVEEGESFALIGPNGAGKSTALKLITRISSPSSGTVRLRGRVAALMEVGSGVHPELTGRENIWLYGQILGMKKSEIRGRFDEIVDFSELAHALDTPVKFYSSGMQLRLGFSIAAFLDPDIFVVDEALAVGDAGFQAKCAERMRKLVAEGRTLLFVSHNLPVLETICSRALLLLDGEIDTIGDTPKVISRYMDWVDERNERRRLESGSVVGRGLEVRKTTLHGLDGTERYSFMPGEGLIVRLHVQSTVDYGKCWVSVGLSDGRLGALVICSMLERPTGTDFPPGDHDVSCRIENLPLAARHYEVWMCIHDPSASTALVEWSRVANFRIERTVERGPANLALPWMSGPVRVQHSWDQARSNESSVV